MLVDPFESEVDSLFSGWRGPRLPVVLDEAWKVDKEGDVGAYWGIWDKDGNPKYY